jgi:hypothetical protein
VKKSSGTLTIAPKFNCVVLVLEVVLEVMLEEVVGLLWMTLRLMLLTLLVLEWKGVGAKASTDTLLMAKVVNMNKVVLMNLMSCR